MSSACVPNPNPELKFSNCCPSEWDPRRGVLEPVARGAPRFAPAAGCIGVSVGIGTTLGAGMLSRNKDVCCRYSAGCCWDLESWCLDSAGCWWDFKTCWRDLENGCRLENGSALENASDADGTSIARPPGRASSAGAAADITGYISGPGRGEAACNRRPQRRQRRSSSSFEALQNRHSMWRFRRGLLTRSIPLCYGSRLEHSSYGHVARPADQRTCIFLANIIRDVCHAFCLIPLRL